MVACVPIAKCRSFPEDRNIWGGFSNHVKVDRGGGGGGGGGKGDMVVVVVGEVEEEERQEAKEWRCVPKGHPVFVLMVENEDKSSSQGRRESWSHCWLLHELVEKRVWPFLEGG